MITCSVENNGDHQEVQEASHLCHQLIKSSRSLASTKIPHILSLHRHFLVGAQRVPQRIYTWTAYVHWPLTHLTCNQRGWWCGWMEKQQTRHVWHVWPGCHHINWKLIQTDSDPKDYTVVISVAECSSSIGHHSWLNGLFAYFWCHWIFLIGS